MSFEEIITKMENAVDYMDLYDAASYIIDDDLRVAAEQLIEECENDNVSVEEAYSLIISLIEELGEEEAKKFFPIKAYDIDKDIIQEAKSGKINGAEGDRESISCNTKGCIDKYFTVTKGDNPMYKCCYFYPKLNIKNLVEFEQADIADKIVDINPKDSIVLCRNFWPYLDEQKSSILFDKLCKKLDKSSLLVLGSFDLSNCFSMRDILKANNYVEVYKNTFKKAS